jgi:hypothetical protein
MSDKIARLGIERDNDMMYYIKNGDVWATPRKQKGRPKGRPQKVASTGLDMDYSRYIYFLDSDGDVARKERALGGGRSKSKSKPKASPTPKPPKLKAPKAEPKAKTRTTARSAITGHYVTEATAKRHPKTTVENTIEVGKKSPAQLDREIEECLARSKKR